MTHASTLCPSVSFNSDVPRISSSSPVQGTTVAQAERNSRIEQYLPLVGNVLTQMSRNLPTHIDTDELYSAGITGLIAAAERFNSEQAQTFQGYVCLRIKGAMLDELRRLDPTPRKSRALTKKIQVAVQEIEQELGRAPFDREVSERLKISVTELEQWRRRSAPVQLMSLDRQAESDASTGSTLHEMLADDTEDVRATMEKEELQQLLTDRIAAMPVQQKRVLVFYYFEAMTFAEIGLALDLTEARICQIHKHAIANLKSYLRSLRGN